MSSQTVGITVTDTIDGTMTPNCTTTPAYNANQVGTYTVSCTATDSQNYTTTFTRTITISSIDKQPLQTKIDEAKTKIADPKVINNQAKTDLQNKITEAENTLNDDNLTTAKRDELIAQLTDLISKIKRDTILPLFNPTNPAKIITRKGTPVNLNDVTVDDGVGASGIDANGIVMTTSPNLDANNPAKGNYTVTYSATDNAGNNTTVHREVEITDADELQAEVNKVTPALLNGKTPDSVKAVNDAKKEAEDVINNPTASQHDIDDALDTLKKAIQNLRTIQSSQPSTPSIGGGGYVVPAPTTPKQPTVPTQPVAPTPPTQPTPVPHPQVQPSLPVGEI